MENQAVLWFRHRVLQRWVPIMRSGDDLFGHTITMPEYDHFGDYYLDQTGGAYWLARSIVGSVVCFHKPRWITFGSWMTRR